MAAPPSSQNVRALDLQAVRRILRRQCRAASPPWLHGEVASRMAERLQVVRAVPQQVIDWGSALGASGERLRQVYPSARILAVEQEGLLTAQHEAAPGWRRFLPRAKPAAPHFVPPEEVPEGTAQLVWSNMLLQRLADPPAVMAQWHRALAVDGFLMFSTLGPGTLAELRGLYAEAGWGSPMAPLVDMHDLGDMLVHAGLADPVMDQETVVLHWAEPAAALAELQALGGNADPARHAGLRTPRWRQRLLQALAGRADAKGRIALSFELVYGHAFKPPPRPKLAPTTAVSLDEMRTLVRRPRS